MKTICIKRKANERVVVYTKAFCYKGDTYHPRTETEKGYAEFSEHFRNIKFCCRTLELTCEEEKYSDSNQFIICRRNIRSFSICNLVISYCPFCGKKFPKELGLEWIHLVEKEFGEEYLSPPKMYELPEEWLTDEWWVKREL